MIEVIKYSENFREDWNRFLATCKNRHFMFQREFMEYHADRYVEHSQLVFNKEKLVAILPANLSDSEVSSHGWLSFGGFLCNKTMTVSLMLEVFDALTDTFRSQNILTFIYKTMPYIYHQQPADEDLYALFRNKAQLFRRDVSSVVDLQSNFILSKKKRQFVKKVEQVDGLSIRASEDIVEFWEILTSLLEDRYHKSPAHTVEEITFLKQKFPEQIRFFGVYVCKQLIGGALIFKNEKTLHVQYIASNDLCREIGGLHALFAFLITKHFKNYRFFDFGISNEQNGWFLNEGLSAFKESFGARAIVHDFYRLTIR